MRSSHGLEGLGLGNTMQDLSSSDLMRNDWDAAVLHGS